MINHINVSLCDIDMENKDEMKAKNVVGKVAGKKEEDFYYMTKDFRLLNLCCNGKFQLSKEGELNYFNEE